MGRKKKVVEETNFSSNPAEVKSVEKPSFKDYKYGTLVQDCNRCGHRHILEAGIEGGIQIMLPTTDKHHLIMECPQCKNTIIWHYIEAFEPGPRAKQKENEPVQEENKEVESV